MPGVSAGSPSRKTRKASVPPVEAPTTTTFSVVRIIALPVGLAKTTSALNFGSARKVAGASLRTLTLAAALTVSQMRTWASCKNCLVPRAGFSIISTAPYSRALRADSEPLPVRLEHMTTGIGCWLMILRRKVRPSMRGISTSRVMTSGIPSLSRSAATKGSEAVAMISISGSELRMSARV